MPPFDTILIANRGEIARRVIRTARAMGYRTVAVFSDADADAPHVRDADIAVRIGPAEARESYLSVPAILDAARRTGAQALHPGYGFLSENAAFAEACADAGLVFVGPPAEAIALMGDKGAAKRRMEAAGVPCIPGYSGEDQSLDTLLAEGARIGAPLMVKATAGGGGRGIRVVDDVARLEEALSDARAEAEASFGAGDLILERALVNPRHVEVQVFADSHGHAIHLGERDCSIQRRRQKIIEEAPSPAVDETTREHMGSAAVAAAKAIGYVGAGTVEFLLEDDGRFWFMEMNTRLQVEHPVTEMITGLDLVELQLRVAAGEALALAQHEVAFRGHAIEARLCAEDPATGFLPSTGRVLLWRRPTGEHIRVDHGLRRGAEITAHYDPMVAKIIAWGETREAARRRLIAALDRTALLGVATNRDVLRAALAHPQFRDGKATTGFVAEAGDALLARDPAADALRAAVGAAVLHAAAGGRAADGLSDAVPARWRLTVDGEPREASVVRQGDGFDVAFDGAAPLRLRRLEAVRGRLIVESDRIVRRGAFAFDGGDAVIIDLEGGVTRIDNIAARPPAAADAAASGAVKAPMHGRVVRVAVAAGANVTRGETLVVLEAMKMQHAITAPANAQVAEVLVNDGDQVATATVLVRFAEAG